jgi:outer membrane protein
MKIRFISITAAALLLGAAIAPAAIAADLGDVGFVDQAAIGTLPAFQSANAQLAAYKGQLDGQFNAAMKGAKSDADRQRITLEFQQKFSDRQREVVGPLYTKAQIAIAKVCSADSLTVIVDKRIVIYGGRDVTKEVIDMLQSSEALVPPSATPAPSEIGFVDQTALDSLPKVKQANDDFSKFAQDQRAAFSAKLASARTDADKQQVGKDYNKVLADKQDQLLKPLVDQTKSVTADVAKKKNLLLVIDRADVIFGGTDITKDVQDALSK